MIDNINEKVVNLLIKNNLKISVAESITGGLIAKYITDVKNASIVLDVSYVTYASSKKIEVLQVDRELIAKYGVVSREVAEDMARKLYNKEKVDIAVSTTGNAGPMVLSNKPVGMAYIGICFKGETEVIECEYKGLRNEIREAVAERAFIELFKKL